MLIGSRHYQSPGSVERGGRAASGSYKISEAAHRNARADQKWRKSQPTQGLLKCECTRSGKRKPARHQPKPQGHKASYVKRAAEDEKNPLAHVAPRICLFLHSRSQLRFSATDERSPGGAVIVSGQTDTVSSSRSGEARHRRNTNNATSKNRIPPVRSSPTSRIEPVRDGSKVWCHSSSIAVNKVIESARMAQRSFNPRADRVWNHARNSSRHRIPYPVTCPPFRSRWWKRAKVSGDMRRCSQPNSSQR